MKTKRNDPCPCGSGKKYKKCCLLADSISSPEYPMQFFGYDQKSGNPDPVCMVSEVTSINQEPIESMYEKTFPIGEWFISFGAHDDVEVIGPITQLEDALDIGKQRYPSISFTSSFMK